MLVTSNLRELYEIDDYLWLEKTIKLLKNRQFSELDLDNLIEELEALGRSEKRTVKSFLEQIIRHLLCLQYWEQEYDYTHHHWEAELYSFRRQLNDEITANLRNYLSSELDTIYESALGYINRKSKNKLTQIPKNCPYTLEQLLDENWLP